jgi:hypothetical protein
MKLKLTPFLAFGLLSALLVSSTSGADSLIRNGDFSDGSAPWFLIELNNAEGRIEVRTEEQTRKTYARVHLVNPGAGHWDMRLTQTGFSIQAEKTYLVQFRARSSAYRVFGVALLDPHAPLQGKWDLVADTNWQEYSVTLRAPRSASDAALIFGNLGLNSGWVDITDVKVTPN